MLTNLLGPALVIALIHVTFVTMKRPSVMTYMTSCRSVFISFIFYFWVFFNPFFFSNHGFGLKLIIQLLHFLAKQALWCSPCLGISNIIGSLFHYADLGDHWNMAYVVLCKQEERGKQRHLNIEFYV